VVQPETVVRRCIRRASTKQKCNLLVKNKQCGPSRQLGGQTPQWCTVVHSVAQCFFAGFLRVFFGFPALFLFMFIFVFLFWGRTERGNPGPRARPLGFGPIPEEIGFAPSGQGHDFELGWINYRLESGVDGRLGVR